MDWTMFLSVGILGYIFWLIVMIIINRFGKKSKTKNTTDFLLDQYILKLDTNKVYREYMHQMLIKNTEYDFQIVNNYADFQTELYLSLGGLLKNKKYYENIVSMLLYISNRYYWSALKTLPSFIHAFIVIRFNGLTIMENTMHMLTLHATSIGGYLSQSLNEDFYSTLKKVRIVRENTGYVKGKSVIFARVRNPFIGSRVCPLASRHKDLIFPPLDIKHDYLNLKNYGNALGVIGTNDDQHILDDKPMDQYSFMTNSDYWEKEFSNVKQNKNMII